ncbi:hypothetical protein M0813_02243 [Anaeramoeba flamelloides]|uniref:Uncharacterized protein n=1 Tax=Anaeramoeba flamelloides TaxID=1746091 RepID=A0ABQ8YR46_9EUKA|nr:hypothetical protein M0813_02243 [Anaeramoeba flamelloides]
MTNTQNNMNTNTGTYTGTYTETNTNMNTMDMPSNMDNTMGGFNYNYDYSGNNQNSGFGNMSNNMNMNLNMNTNTNTSMDNNVEQGYYYNETITASDPLITQKKTKDRAQKTKKTQMLVNTNAMQKRKQKRLAVCSCMTCVWIIIIIIIVFAETRSHYFSFGNGNSAASYCLSSSSIYFPTKLKKYEWVFPNDDTIFNTEIYWTGSWEIKFRNNGGISQYLTLESDKCYRVYSDQSTDNCYSEFIGRGNEDYDYNVCEIIN